MKYLIDTNICIYIMNNRPPDILQKFKPFDPGEIGISTITVSEIQYGVAKSVRRKENQLRVDEFLAPFEICAYDETAARSYGDIRVRLEKAGKPIGSLDLLIASQALSQNLILVTNNEKEFTRIKRLKVENWAR
ncbi:MAG: type II toxin-antitoxin system VapC family toxin [Desulfobacterales bacterium]